MPDLATFINDQVDSGAVASFVNDARSQFRINMPDGSVTNYLGARLLPVVLQTDNIVEDGGIDWIAPIGVDGTLYSRVPLRQAMEGQSALYRLGVNDAGAQLTPKDYDFIVQAVRKGNIPGAQEVLRNFLLVAAIKPLNDIIEKQRWQAIVDAQIIRRGDNDYREVVGYENPTGHRVTIASGTTAAPTGWYDSAHDPFTDIQAIADSMGTVTHIVTSRRIVSALAAHPMVKNRVGLTTFTASGDLTTLAGRATVDAINGTLQADGLPPITVYEGFYNDEYGNRKRFLRDDAFVMLNASAIEPEATIDANPNYIRPGSLGFVGMGINAGQTQPGRNVYLSVNANTKAPSLRGEGTQRSLPIIRDRENNQRIGVINIPRPQ